MCASELLTQEQETALFREMNFLKYRASVLRSEIDLDKLDPLVIESIEAMLRRAQAIRDHIIQANMRLVMSIVKKFRHASAVLRRYVERRPLYADASCREV